MTLKERLDAYEQLMRLDKPIGILLLLWPVLWGLWLGAPGLVRLCTPRPLLGRGRLASRAGGGKEARPARPAAKPRQPPPRAAQRARIDHAVREDHRRAPA